MLSLWRDRWGKTPTVARQLPYIQGKINRWSNRIVQASLWSLPAATVAIAAACVLLAGLMLSVRLSLNSQIVASGLLIASAIFLRRYAGTLVTLALVALSLLVSIRYLWWRFDDTLGSMLDLEFMLGFCLCVAELYLALRTATGLVRAIWPLSRAVVPMPADKVAWPTVDVFVLCGGEPLPAMAAAVTRALAFDWTRKKVRIYVVDDEYREDIEKQAHAMSVTYLACVQGSEGSADQVNQALQHSGGELIALVDCAYHAGNAFLTQITGWFLRDAKLGMLLTPGHFLAPPASALSMALFDSTAGSGSCAMLRRAMLVEAGGAEPALVTWQAHTALKLQALGYGSAYLGVPSPSRDDAGAGADSDRAPLIRVDHPFSDRALWCKQRLAEFDEALKFYYPLARLVFFTAPLAYLFAGLDLIQSSPELLAAYAVPHLIHGHIAHARTQGQNRFTIVADLREMLLACYLMLPTTVNVVRTGFGRFIRRNRHAQAPGETPFDWKLAIPYALVIVLCRLGVIAGIIRLFYIGPDELEMACFYLLWCVGNLLILTSTLAVSKESLQIRHHVRVQAQRPAMVKLPHGRTITCVTENFPDIELALRLPTNLLIDTGTVLGITIFHGGQEFSFPARFTDCQDQLLHVVIDEPARARYQDVADAALSRGADWPKWLAGPQADQPLPAWISKGIINMLIAILDFATHSGQYLRWLSLDHWIQLWKKKK